MSVGISKNPTKSLTHLSGLPNVDVRLSLGVQKKIDYLHKIYKSVEWSGFIYYRIVGDNHILSENLELEVVDFFPMSVDSSAYTEFKAAQLEASNSVDFQNLEFSGLRKGVIHTHHNMNTFFSGTDLDEIYDNTAFFSTVLGDESRPIDFYLSMITNIANNTIARVIKSATIKQEITTKVNKSITKRTSTIGSPFYESLNNVEEEEQLVPETTTTINTVEYYYRDCNVVVDRDTTIPEGFIERFVNELAFMNKKSTQAVKTHYPNSNYSGTSYYGTGTTVVNSNNSKSSATTVAQSYNQMRFPYEQDDDEEYKGYQSSSSKEITPQTQFRHGIYDNLDYDEGYIHYSKNFNRPEGRKLYGVIFRAAGLSENQPPFALGYGKIKAVTLPYKSDITFKKAVYLMTGTEIDKKSFAKGNLENIAEYSLKVLEEIEKYSSHVWETSENFDGSFTTLLSKIRKVLSNELLFNQTAKA